MNDSTRGSWVSEMVDSLTLLAANAKTNEAREAVLGLCLLAQKAVKFRLPVKAQFFADHDGGFHSDMEEIHLPYPLIAVEYSAGNDPPDESLERSSRRIVLAFEVPDATLGTAIRMLPINYWDRYGQWVPNPIGLAVPTKGGVPKDLPPGKKGLICYDFPIIPGAAPLSTMSFEEQNRARGETMDDACAVANLVDVLACSNVHKREVTPAPGLVKKAAKAEKAPLSSYYVLEISPLQEPVVGAQTHGTHASPRQHLRRGHIRRLRDGRRIWINDAVVGDPSKGTVTKDYRVTGK